MYSNLKLFCAFPLIDVKPQNLQLILEPWLLLCVSICGVTGLGGVACFHFYCNVIVFTQLEISDSTVSESLNVLVSPVLSFMPKYKLSLEKV